MATLTSTALPHQVPTSPKSSRHREAYPLTQLGIAVNVPLAKLLDETDPDTGFGLKPGGTQV